jgi:RNA polymerase sigma-70 factor (ECF subfamily)
VINAPALPRPLFVRAADRPLSPEAARPAGAAELEAFGKALQREAPVLLAAARAITLDDAEAEDLVQATFELALRHRASLREPAALRRWLLTIQAREAFRLVRRLRRLVRLGPAVTEIAVPEPTTADSVAVRDALRSLSPRVRAAVVLHHMAGLPVAEVAAALGVSPNTVKTQLKVGLASLREALGDE